MIERLIKFILRNSKAIIVAAGLITIVLSFWLPKLEIGSERAMVFPSKHDPERSYLERTYRYFGSDVIQVIAITSDNIFTYPVLKKIQTLTAQIGMMSAVDRVFSITNADIIKGWGNKILVKDLSSLHRELIVKSGGYVKVGPEEIFLKIASESVPQSAEKIEWFKEDILGNPLYINSIISRDLKTTVINVFLDGRVDMAVQKETANKIEKLTLKYFHPEEVQFVSLLSASSLIFKMLSHDMTVYLPLTLLIVMVILLISFRSWKVVLLSLVSISMAVACTYAIMAMFNIPIFILTAAIPPIIAAQGVAYCIHIFSEYFRQSAFSGHSRRIVEQTLRYVLLSISLSAITTAIGFASISPVDVVAIKQMGIFLSLGIVITFFMISFFIPAVLIYTPLRSHVGMRTGDPLSRYSFDWLPRFSIRRRHYIFIFTAIISLVGFYGLSKIVVETDIYQLFPKSSPFRKAAELVSEKLQGTTPVNIIIETPQEGDLQEPALLKSIEKLQVTLDEQPVVGKTISVVDYIKFINKALHENNEQYYAVPDSRETISRYLKVYSLADSSGNMNRYMDNDRKVANISLQSSLRKTQDIINFKKFIEEQCSRMLPPEVSWKVTGESILISSTAQKLSRGVLIGFSQAGLAIFLIMLLLFRSFRVGIAAMIPNLTPLLFVLGVMGFAHIDFNVATSIIICISIGIAVDDTIHFLVRYFYELKRTNHYLIRANTGVKITSDQKRAIINTFRHKHGPITLIAVTVILGFIVLAFSDFVPMAMFGLLTALAMAFGIICELVILPALLASIEV